MDLNSDLNLMDEGIAMLDKQMSILNNLIGEVERYNEKLRQAKDEYRIRMRHSTNAKIIDGQEYYHCKFHQRYEIKSDICLSNGKSKGYCRAGISLWNKLNQKRNTLNYKIERMIRLTYTFKSFKNNIEAYKDKFNNPTYYDYERDWANFRNNNYKG